MNKLNVEDSYLTVLENEATLKHFREDFLLRSTKYIFNTIQFQNDEVLVVANRILWEILTYCMKHFEE